MDSGKALREQQRYTDELKKENFGLKMKIFYLEEQLNQFLSHSLVEKDVSDILQQNIELKVENEKRQVELEKFQQLLVEARNTINSLRSTSPTQPIEFEWSKEQQKRYEANNHELDKLKAELRSRDNDCLNLKLEAEKNKMGLEAALKKLEARTQFQTEAHMIEEVVKGHRNQIEMLEKELMNSKGQNYHLNASLSQRNVEYESLKSENESLKIQLHSRPMDNSFTTDHSLHFGPIANPQLEQGISMMRDQISDLKMKLIEKAAELDQLSLDSDAKGQAHARVVQQISDNFQREESKYKVIIAELRDQLEALKLEYQKSSTESERARNAHQAEESTHSLERQALERQLSKLEKEYAELGMKLEQTMNQAATLEGTLQLREGQIENMTRQLEAKTRTSQESERDYRAALDQKTTKINTLNTEISSLQIQLRTKENDLVLAHEQLDRQTKALVDLEAENTQRTHDVTLANTNLRVSMEHQISEFKEKTNTLLTQLRIKESEAEKYKTELDMQSVGVEEIMKNFENMKMRKKEDDRKWMEEREKMELERIQDKNKIEDLQSKCRDANIINDRLSEEMGILESKLKTQYQNIHEHNEIINNKEQELKSKSKLINELRTKLSETETVLMKEHLVVERSEERFKTQVQQRNQLLLQIQTMIDPLLTKEQRSRLEFNSSSPNENFGEFTDMIMSKIGFISKLASKFDSHVKEVQTKLQDEYRSLSTNVDKRISQIERFESIVREAAMIQRKLKDSLTIKQQDLSKAKVRISGLEHEVSSLLHQIATIESASAVAQSNDKSQLMELRARNMELEGMLKITQNQLQQEENSNRELDDNLRKERDSNFRKIAELNESLRLNKIELESSERRANHLDHALKTQKSSFVEATSNIALKKAATQSILESSEAALSKMNERLREEIESQRSAFDRERALLKDRERENLKLKSDNAHLKRRLDKREVMINMALAKLELVNNRRDSVQNAILHQFTDEMRLMMRSSNDSTLHNAAKTLSSSLMDTSAPVKDQPPLSASYSANTNNARVFNSSNYQTTYSRQYTSANSDSTQPRYNPDSLFVKPHNLSVNVNKPSLVTATVDGMLGHRVPGGVGLFSESKTKSEIKNKVNDIQVPNGRVTPVEVFK